MIPRSQHFGDRAPFPFNRPGIMRVFEKAAFKAFLLTARRGAHYPGKQPNASVEQGERGRLAARQHIVADRDRNDRPRLEQALVDPLEAAAQDGDAGARRELADQRLGRAARRAGVIASFGRGRPATLSSAAASTSARITIPAPPPAGVSSTERCLSVAKSRIWTVSSDQIPSRQRAPGEAQAERPGEHLRDRG